MSPQEFDPTGAKILDGAIRVLSDFGVKRATVELVAKYAGVSHMTIYRRWPSKSDLLKAAVVGEFTEILDTAFSQAAGNGGSFAQRCLSAFADIVWTLQNHPLVVREMDSDSGEQLLSSTSASIMEVSVPLIAERLARLDPTPQDPDLASLADVFVRLAHSLVVVGRPGQPLAGREQVAAYARDCFGPYLQPRTLPQSGSDVRRQRPYLQVAAALVLTVLALGVGLTAGRSTDVKLPFITPANASKSPAPATPISATPEIPAGQIGAGDSTPAVEPRTPATAGEPPITAAVPDRQAGVTSFPAGQSPAGPIGSGGVGAAGGGSAPVMPDVKRPPPPPVGAGPNGGPPPPPPPGSKPPRPPAPGPGPGPGPKPAGPGPGPGPAGPGPGPGPSPGPAGSINRGGSGPG